MKENSGKGWKTGALCKGGVIEGEKPCGNIWKITEKNLVVITINVMDECEMECIGVRCPECGTFTELPYEAVPETIKNRVLKEYYRFKKGKSSRKSFKEWLVSIFG